MTTEEHDLDPNDAIELSLIDDTEIDEAKIPNSDLDGEPEEVEGAQPVDEADWADVNLNDYIEEAG